VKKISRPLFLSEINEFNKIKKIVNDEKIYARVVSSALIIKTDRDRSVND
jgi:hypothetical protein